MRTFVGLALLLVPVALFAQAPSVTVSLDALQLRRTNVPGHEGHETAVRDGHLRTGVINYDVRYCSCWDPAHAPGVGYLEGTIGLPGPSAANWYHGGFLHLFINGQNLGVTKLGDMWVSEQGSRGSLRMFWDTPAAAVLISFLTLAGDDRLFVQINLTPHTEIKELKLALQAYPSFFTYANRRPGDRKCLTATQTYDQGAKADLDVGRQSWLALYDTIFDPDKGEGDGGCAVLWRPEQMQAASLSLGDYGTTINLQCQPDVRQLRLVFWDFNRRGNATALRRLQEALPATQALLPTLDFAPLNLVKYQAGAARDQALKDLAPVKGGDVLAAKVRAAADQIIAEQQVVVAGSEASPAVAEKALADQIDRFNALLWDVRFFVLIHG